MEKIEDLSNKRLLEELEEVEERISAEYKILNSYKGRKKEIEEEMKKRLS